MKHKLKQILEVILGILVSLPICIATIVCTFALLMSIGFTLIVILIIGIPIVLIMGIIKNASFNKMNKPVIGIIKEETYETNQEDELEKDL